MIHKPDYARNTATGMWRVKCSSCEWWERYGTEAEVVGLFAVHDIEQWEPAVPATAPATAHAQ